MDYKFLDKVLDQIVSETRIDHDKGKIYVPYYSSSHSYLIFFDLSVISRFFRIHCKNIYGLNEQETEYVWEKYKEIIKDKINNG